MASEWNASRTSRNTLHVQNTRTGAHFEAVDEAEVNDTIAAINAYNAQQEAAKQPADKSAVDLPVGETVVRSN